MLSVGKTVFIALLIYYLPIILDHFRDRYHIYQKNGHLNVINATYIVSIDNILCFTKHLYVRVLYT